MRTRSKYKVPHIGWNRVNVKKTSSLCRVPTAESEFYFVHAYHMRVSERSDILSETATSKVFRPPSRETIFSACSFTRKRATMRGGRILKNFVEL